MPRDITFQSVPREVVSLLREQVGSAMQIIAALVLTDEEVLAIRKEDDPELRPENLIGWAKEMREEMLSDEWRPQLVAAIRQQGFLTSTHPGFPLGALGHKVYSEFRLAEAYADLEQMLQEYADGKGDDPPEHEDRKGMSDARYRASMDRHEKAVKAFWAAKLVEKGHDPKVAKFCLQWGGYALSLQASMERLMRPVRAAQGSGEASALVQGTKTEP